MANDKSFKVKNGLLAGRYLQSNGTETAGANGPYGTFSTDLYTGNGSSQTITNNIDLSTDGGLVWVKNRDLSRDHALHDTERGIDYRLSSNTTSGQSGAISGGITPTTTGFSLGSNIYLNDNTYDHVAWTFKKASNFFDIVTYTGDFTTSRSISHNLGSAPGSIFIKQTSGSAENWIVWHRSISNQVSGQILYLNATDSQSSMNGKFDDTNLPTSTTFTVEQDNSVNASGASYVAYLFGHDTSADGYIQCGSYTGNGSATGPEIDLGWEPSWLLVKRASSAEFWQIVDNVRGVTTGGNDAILYPNATNAEVTTNGPPPIWGGFV